MKIKLLILLLWAGVVWGQEIKIGQLFTLITPAKHSKTDLNNSNIYVNDFPNYLEDGIKYKIVNITGNVITVMVSPAFNDLKDKSKISKATYYNYKLFDMNKDEYLAKAKNQEEIPDRFSIGILTLPFKFRPQDEKTFEAQFNLNSTLNMRLGSLWSTYYYLQLGAGLGSVELNSNNSLGIGVDENINAATLTMFSGIMLQYKKVQAGIYVGVDHINNQNHYQWRNNGNIWFGFGVGYQLFNIGLGDDNKNN